MKPGGPTPAPAAQDHSQAPAAPGDLFVLRETADFPLEWLVVERDRQDPARLRVVPADGEPSTGSADVRVPGGAAGPLNLRCGHALWLPATFLSPELRTGRLETADLERAAARLAEIDRSGEGAAPTSPLGLETDRDPEYLDWIAETVAPAARALAAAVATVPPAIVRAEDRRATGLEPPLRRDRQRRFYRLAAAALLAVALGLSWNTAVLRREIDALSQPYLEGDDQEVQLAVTRGSAEPVHKTVARDATAVHVPISLGQDFPAGITGHLDVIDLAGKRVWRSPSFRMDLRASKILTLPRRFIPGRYRLELRRDGAGASEPPLEHGALELEFAPS